ncbi:MAG: hypothetical protein QM635_06040 [Microbacteriaceae bacterium]
MTAHDLSTRPSTRPLSAHDLSAHDLDAHRLDADHLISYRPHTDTASVPTQEEVAPPGSARAPVSPHHPIRNALGLVALVVLPALGAALVTVATGIAPLIR